MLGVGLPRAEDCQKPQALSSRSALRHRIDVMNTKTEPTAPAQEDAAPETPSETTGVLGDLASAARKSAGKTAWMGAAVGVGSAAIVAALLYAKKRG